MNMAKIGATIWNGIENGIKQSKSCNDFKHKVKEIFSRI